jgi:SAM-dependent methyltransferase
VRGSATPACSADAFEQRYRANPDPWNFASSDYEHYRYRITLEHLSRSRYCRAFEPGCSVGVLTAHLAERCDEVVATDISRTALSQAYARCADLDNVQFVHASVESNLPFGRFDLIVFSEIGYYFLPEKLACLSKRLGAVLESGGEFMAVHWLGESEDHVLHGDEVHDVLQQNLRLAHKVSQRYECFRIDTWINE